MDGSIQLSREERKALLEVYRSGDARVARRAHALLLLDDGLSYRQIRAVLYASNDLIAECVRRFRQGASTRLWKVNGRSCLRRLIGCRSCKTG